MSSTQINKSWEGESLRTETPVGDMGKTRKPNLRGNLRTSTWNESQDERVD